MKRLLSALILFFCIFALCGCGVKTSFNVFVDSAVNKKALPSGSFKQGDSFCIFTDTKETPLLSSEIQEKIERLIVDKGYKVQDDCTTSRYCLIFRYSITSSSQTLHITQPSSSYITSDGSSATVSHTPSVSRSVDVVSYHRGISLFVYDSKAILDKKAVLVWQGTTISTGQSNDLRYVSNYMLVPLFNYFGVSSNQKLYFNVPEDSKEVEAFKESLSSLEIDRVLKLYDGAKKKVVNLRE